MRMSEHRWSSRSLLLLSCLASSLSAYGQLTGRLYLEKTTFAPNESIVVHVEIKNSGTVPEKINITNMPQQPLCAGYEEAVLKAPHGASPDVVLGNNCNINGQFSYESLLPGKTYTGVIPLNRYFKSMVPGDYWIQVNHVESPSLKAKLHFRLTGSSITSTSR